MTKTMKHLLWIVLSALLITSCTESKQQEHYTLIVSLDGFRADYRDWYETPQLDRIAADGVEATMLPSFPASTFPNHYTIATGLVPDHHGIVDNSFYDTVTEKSYSLGDKDTRTNVDYYGGEPIWNTAMNQGLKVGTVYWVGSDIPIGGTYPTYWQDYLVQPLIPFEERIDTVMDWFRKPESERPRLVMSYYDEPDHAGHVYTPRGAGTKACVEHLDSLMGRLYDSIQTLDIADRLNIIITSDHGMAEVSNQRVVKPSDYIKPEWVVRMSGGTPTSITTKPEFRDSVYNALKKAEHLNVWKREEIPAEVNYGSYTTRIGDIVVSPEVGWKFSEKAGDDKGGAHGYLPSDPQMQVMFVAAGPDFKKGYKSEKFNNTDIYIMLCKLLNIEPKETDGVWEHIAPLFAE